MASSLSLVIVDQIDIECVAIFESESHPPIARIRNAPQSLSVTPEGMQPLSRQIDIA